MTENQFTTEEVENEIWKLVDGYDGAYAISNLGRVRREKGGAGCQAGRILNPRLSKGYLRLILYRSGSFKNHTIHQLVAAAFIGIQLPKMQVNHKDGCKTNNRVENLEYLTAKDNKRHASRLGLVATKANGRYTHPGDKRSGKNHHSYKHPEKVGRGAQLNHSTLTDEKVRIIRRLAAKGVSYPDLAILCDVSPQNIFYIVDRQTWRHVD